jgi:hypothetical protein
LWLAVVLVLGVALLGGVIGVRSYLGEREDTQIRQLVQENRRLAREGEQAHDAICALRNDLARRVQTSRDFLKDNPTGIPGLPAAVISRSIRDQDRTVDTLDQVIDCTGGPP